MATIILNTKDAALFEIIVFIELIWQAKITLSISWDLFIPYFIVSMIYLILVILTNYINKKTKNYHNQLVK